MKKSFSLYMMACLLFVSAGVDSAPTMRIIGGVGGTDSQIDFSDLNKGKMKPEVTVKGSNGVECINIAGRWNVSEDLTYTCEAEGETLTDSISGTGTVDISQEGCSISYTPPSFNEPRTGQIKGNMISLSGRFFIPFTSDINLSENNFTATGAVNNPDQFTLIGNGVAKGTASGIPFSCTGQSSPKFTRDAALRNRIECLLNWAENNYPNLFSPAGATSQFQSPYTYRYYSGTNSYVGVSADNNHVYYLGPNGGFPVDQGDLSGWLTKASCQ